MLIKKEFDKNIMKLTNIYSNEKLNSFKTVGINSPKVKEVYGTELNFPEIPENRPYIFGSFVTTVDGKLAYEDYPGAFEVAGRNSFAGAGGLTDFWWLQVLRGASDALILGAKSITIEEEYTGHCWDQDLEDYRIERNERKIPINIVVSTDAKDIPLNHMIFTRKDIPSVISAAPSALEYLKESMKDVKIIGPLKDETFVHIEEVKEIFRDIDNGKTVAILTGEENTPNIGALMKVLRVAGIEKLLIESPTYAHLLIKEEIFDEGFFNMSCVYIGGNAVSLGKFDKAFGATYHPHTEVLSIGMHSPHMLFFRHKFAYGIETK
ncbi:MAG: dihydrofolate reductase family protein [Cetobacterium sp.]|uniref:dihydrofolate reductase family protein n=1 Tax=Cetobacterium sp. TaxID=2071632 RepID=UPI003F30CBBA